MESHILWLVNSEVKQNWDSQYQQLSRNAPLESHFLFRDDVTKRIMTNHCKQKNDTKLKLIQEFKKLLIILHFTWVSEQMGRTSQNHPTTATSSSQTRETGYGKLYAIWIEQFNRRFKILKTFREETGNLLLNILKILHKH